LVGSSLTKVLTPVYWEIFSYEMELKTIRVINEKYGILSMAQFKIKHYL
jgi:hypothetical protein